MKVFGKIAFLSLMIFCVFFDRKTRDKQINKGIENNSSVVINQQKEKMELRKCKNIVLLQAKRRHANFSRIKDASAPNVVVASNSVPNPSYPFEGISYAIFYNFRQLREENY